MIAIATSATSMYATLSRLWQSMGRPLAAVIILVVGGKISTTLKRHRQLNNMACAEVSSPVPGSSRRLMSNGMNVSIGKAINASSELKLKYSDSSVSAVIWRMPSSLFNSRNIAEKREAPPPMCSSICDVLCKKELNARAPLKSAGPKRCKPSDPELLFLWAEDDIGWASSLGELDALADMALVKSFAALDVASIAEVSQSSVESASAGPLF
mmetsp:Transcript_33693/g.78739  ORF Transcript_33693/g.78739 Transcript_33693/m.78739 type:complete len:212 (+) Transcript_33693:1808-2443(+)